MTSALEVMGLNLLHKPQITGIFAAMVEEESVILGLKEILSLLMGIC